MADTERFATGCGHRYMPPPASGGAAGYTMSLHTGLTFCFPCSDGAARIELMAQVMGATSTPMLGYVLDDGRVTTWPGGLLGHVVWRVDHPRISVHGKRGTMTYVQVRDVEGGVWHGRFDSDWGQACNLHMTKPKKHTKEGTQ